MLTWKQTESWVNDDGIRVYAGFPLTKEESKAQSPDHVLLEAENGAVLTNLQFVLSMPLLSRVAQTVASVMPPEAAAAGLSLLDLLRMALAAEYVLGPEENPGENRKDHDALIAVKKLIADRFINQPTAHSRNITAGLRGRLHSDELFLQHAANRAVAEGWIETEPEVCWQLAGCCRLAEYLEAEVADESGRDEASSPRGPSHQSVGGPPVA